MTAHVEALVQSLLMEGYALYPYTPSATKNASPTPFGIVYPPAYAAATPRYTHDRIVLRARLLAEGPVSLQVRFLQASGDGFQAVPRRVELDGPGTVELGFPPLHGSVSLAVDRDQVLAEVLNYTPVDPGIDRKEALASSLLSTHLVLRGPRFQSPLEAALESVNTFPVLASDDDDVILGAAIMLPDHPELAPESHGDLFDGTEIEEALLLHVHTLSDGERAEIARSDPTVRAMIERALASTPEDLLALHGRTVVRDRGLAPGAKVVLRPDSERDPYDRMLAGRVATIHRVMTDYDGNTHLALTVDGDPVQDLMRDSGRHLFFKPHEVEVIQ